MSCRFLLASILKDFGLWCVEVDESTVRGRDGTADEGRAFSGYPKPGVDDKNHAGRQVGFALMIDGVEFREIQTYPVPRTELGKVLKTRGSDDLIRGVGNIANPRSGH